MTFVAIYNSTSSKKYDEVVRLVFGDNECIYAVNLVNIKQSFFFLKDDIEKICFEPNSYTL